MSEDILKSHFIFDTSLYAPFSLSRIENSTQTKMSRSWADFTEADNESLYSESFNLEEEMDSGLREEIAVLRERVFDERELREKAERKLESVSHAARQSSTSEELTGRLQKTEEELKHEKSLTADLQKQLEEKEKVFQEEQNRLHKKLSSEIALQATAAKVREETLQKEIQNLKQLRDRDMKQFTKTLSITKEVFEREEKTFQVKTSRLLSEHQTENQGFQEEINNLTSTHKRKIEKLNKQIQDFAQNLANTEEALKKSEKEKLSFMAECGDLKKQIQTSHLKAKNEKDCLEKECIRKLEVSEVEKQTLMREKQVILDNTASLTNAHNNNIEKLNAQIQEFTQNLAKTEDALTKSEKETSYLMVKCGDLLKQIHNKDSEMETLNDTISKMSNFQETLKVEKQALMSEKQGLVTKINSLTNSYNNKIEELNGQIQQFTKELEKAKEEVQKSEKSLETAQLNAKEWETEKLSIVKEMEQLNTNHHEIMTENESLAKKKAELEMALMTETAKTVTLESNLQKEVEQKAEMALKMEEMQKQIEIQNMVSRRWEDDKLTLIKEFNHKLKASEVEHQILMTEKQEFLSKIENSNRQIECLAKDPEKTKEEMKNSEKNNTFLEEQGDLKIQLVSKDADIEIFKDKIHTMSVALKKVTEAARQKAMDWEFERLYILKETERLKHYNLEIEAENETLYKKKAELETALMTEATKTVSLECNLEKEAEQKAEMALKMERMQKQITEIQNKALQVSKSWDNDKQVSLKELYRKVEASEIQNQELMTVIDKQEQAATLEKESHRRALAEVKEETTAILKEAHEMKNELGKRKEEVTTLQQMVNVLEDELDKKQTKWYKKLLRY